MLFLACLLTYIPVDPNLGRAKAPSLLGKGLNSDAGVTGSIVLVRPKAPPPRPAGGPAK
jgi:hypothetical protein